MSILVTHKGYIGSVEFSEEDAVFFGKVKGIRALISYEGSTVQELESDFCDAVDTYLKNCAVEGIEPEKPRPQKICLPSASTKYTSRSAALTSQKVRSAYETAKHKTESE